MNAPANVLDVNDRAPGHAVAEDANLAGQVSHGHEIVEHQPEPQPRRHAVSGGVAQQRGAEVVVGQPREVAVAAHLGIAVGRYRRQLAFFVEIVVAAGAVGAARGGKQEPLDARLLGGLGQANRGQVVDLVGQGRVEIAHRIVRKGGQVDDGVDAPQVRGGHVADVDHSVLAPARHSAERAGLEPVDVEADDVEPFIQQQRHQHAADVTVATRNENPHLTGSFSGDVERQGVLEAGPGRLGRIAQVPDDELAGGARRRVGQQVDG